MRFCQMFCRTLAVALALMIITGCVGLVAPAAAIGATTRADAPGATSTAVGPCYDVQIMGLRGSSEPQFDTEHNMGSLVGPIADSIARQAPDGTTVSFYGLPYQAAAVGISYFESKQQGMSMLHDYLGEIVAACPYMKLVVIGYSQGAHAAGDQLAMESSSITDHVAAFVMFGDLRFNPDTSYVWGTFDPGKYGFFDKRAASDFFSWSTRVFSFCNHGDVACQRTGDLLLDPHDQSVYLANYQADVVNMVGHQLGFPGTGNQISPARAVSAGYSHSCALHYGGTLSCWGHNNYGALGNGTTTSSSTPVTVSAISDAIQPGTGYVYSCALRTGGTISCWGWDGDGQLGNGPPTSLRPIYRTPVSVTGISDATQITAGQGHACALRIGGTISCWGANPNGQLGDGTTTDSSTPVSVTGISDATQITAGPNHSCALRAGGTISCWGSNRNGQLGNGMTTSSSTPVSVTGISDATQITAGSSHSCALRAGGTISCWGANTYGALGNGTTKSSSTPVGVTLVSDATRITAGHNHSCALRAHGAISCWGWNGDGQLGNGTTTNSSTPAYVIGFP